MRLYYYTTLGERRLKPRYAYALWSGLIGFLIGVAVVALPGIV